MSHQIYQVGGAVRDELLGKPVKDRDWVVVGATAEDLVAQGYQQVGKDFPVFLHPKTKEEYALARTERKQGHGYGGFAVFATPDVTLEEDLLRRDLTINAMAKDDAGNLYDPYGGYDDLNARILRHVSPAFEEDPLRVLRLARFYARFYEDGFTIASETAHLVHKMVESGELDHLVAERIWLETHKALSGVNAAHYFKALYDLGALKVVFPALQPYFDEHKTAVEAMFAALRMSIEAEQGMHIRVALLLSIFETMAEVKQFAERYRLSAQEKAAAEKLHAWKDWPTRDLSAAQTWLDLLLGLDAFRKPDQLHDYLASMAIFSELHGDQSAFNEWSKQLLSIYDALSQVDVKPLIENVLPKEIPQKIATHRLEMIDKMIKF